MLHIEHLTHRFAFTEVLTDLSLSLSAGETLAIVGASGCGKSTLLNCVSGLIEPYEGKIDNRFKRMAYVFQQPRLLPWQSVIDNLSFGLKAQGIDRQERYATAIALADRLGLTQEDLKKYPHELSGGMQSRVALGRAWALRPDLLLLDEPFSALDIGLKQELYVYLRQLINEQSSSVLMITHDVMEAMQLADQILVLSAKPGRIMWEHRISIPHQQRDELWVYQQTASFLQQPLVRASFGLPMQQGAALL